MPSASLLSTVNQNAIFEAEQAYNWREDAACAFVPSGMFEVVDRDHPMGEGLNDEERLDLTMTNFEHASTVCARCPVLDQCLAEATVFDLRYTFRAGKIPTELTHSARSHRAKNPDSASAEGGRTCRRGHYVPPSAKGWSGECRQCKNIARTEWRKARKEAGLRPA